MRILLLEDNPADAELIEHELRGTLSGFVLKRVDTGEDFSKELLEFSPDLILSDYDLPRYSGILALSEAKKTCPDAPFILVTGAVTEDRAIEVLTSGARDYVLKNRLHRLVPAVQRALAEAEEHKARQKAERELRDSHTFLEKRVAERTLELEKARLEAEIGKRRLEAALEALPIGMAITDAAGGNTHANRTYEQIWGSPRPLPNAVEDYDAYKAWWVETGRRVQPEEWASAIAVQKGESVFGQLMEIERFDGSRAVILNSASPVRDSRGNITGSAVSIQEITELHQAREAIRQNQARLNWVLEIVGIGFWFNALPLGDLNWDNETRRLFFVPLDCEPTIDLFWSRIHPDDREPTRLAVEAAIQNHTLYKVDHRAVDPDTGEIRWIRSAGQATYAADGRPIQFDGINYDITERKQFEESLHRSEERLRLALDAGRHGTWDWNISTGTIVWNEEHYRVFGYGPGTVTPSYEAWRARVHPEDVDGVEAKMNESMEQGSEYSAQYRVLLTDGTVRWLDAKGRFEFDADKPSVRFYGVIEEITERKQAEETLRESMERFQSVLENSRDTIYRINVKTGSFEYISPSAESVVGFSSGELMAQNSEAEHKMIHPDDLPAMRSALAHLEETGQAEAEYRQRTRSGDYRWVSNHMKLTRDGAGRPLYRDGNIRDVTDRKKTEEQLERSISQLELANKELESFSYSVSHDLRAPLRAIDGFSSMLMKTLEGKLDQEERRRFDLIRDNTKKMNHLIEDLLALSRAGRFELTLKKIDVNKLVNSVWKQEQEAHPDVEVALKTGNLPGAVGDQSLIWQVFSNLLANAVKFTRKRKRALIEVGGKANHEESIYYVKDNGTGFDRKYYEKLFGVFQRLHSENEYEGTGVGLAIVQCIIHRHGGRVWAEGKVGKGAAFYFSLPASNSKQLFRGIKATSDKRAGNRV